MVETQDAASLLHQNDWYKPGLIAVEGNQEHTTPVLNDMKQYLVVKIAKQLGSLIELVPVAGLFPLEAAEQFVSKAVASEPESLFLIQQVGNA